MENENKLSNKKTNKKYLNMFCLSLTVRDGLTRCSFPNSVKRTCTYNYGKSVKKTSALPVTLSNIFGFEIIFLSRLYWFACRICTINQNCTNVKPSIMAF